jgi:hypothetical protein
MASTASRAAASGRQRMAISQALMASARRLRILAFRRGKRDQLQIGPVAKPFVNLQPGGALVAVDENKGRAHARNTPVTG